MLHQVFKKFQSLVLHAGVSPVTELRKELLLSVSGWFILYKGYNSEPTGRDAGMGAGGGVECACPLWARHPPRALAWSRQRLSNPVI